MSEIWCWMKFQHILASRLPNSWIDSCNEGEEAFHSIPERFKRWRGGWEEIPGRISGRRPQGARSVRELRQRYTLPDCLFFVLRECWHRYVNNRVRQGKKLGGGGVMVLTSRDWHWQGQGSHTISANQVIGQGITCRHLLCTVSKNTQFRLPSPELVNRQGWWKVSVMGKLSSVSIEHGTTSQKSECKARPM